MRYGIKRVTVEEICTRARVSKMTFYKFFRNKEDLIMRMLEDLYQEGQARFDAIMAQAIPFSEKIAQFIEFKMDYSKRMSKDFYLDLFNYTPALRQLLETWSQRGREQIIQLFRNAQQDGEIRQDLDLNFFTYIFDYLLALQNDPQFIALFPDTATLAKNWMQFFFYGVMGPSDEPAA